MLRGEILNVCGEKTLKHMHLSCLPLSQWAMRHWGWLCKLVRGVGLELVPCWVWQDDPVTDPAIPRSHFSRQRLVTDLHPLT